MCEQILAGGNPETNRSGKPLKRRPNAHQTKRASNNL